MIKLENNKYVVYSESGKVFGRYDNETAAKKRLSQMEMFKHMKKIGGLSISATKKILQFAKENKIPILRTDTLSHFEKSLTRESKKLNMDLSHLYNDYNKVKNTDAATVHFKDKAFKKNRDGIVYNKKLLDAKGISVSVTTGHETGHLINKAKTFPNILINEQSANKLFRDYAKLSPKDSLLYQKETEKALATYKNGKPSRIQLDRLKSKELAHKIYSKNSFGEGNLKKTAQLSTPTEDFWNDSVLQNIDYANYVAKHKYNLGVAGVKMGLSPWKIIAHDWSKFKPKSFDIYEDYWFGPKGIRGTQDPETSVKFREQAEKHYRTEKHHNHKIGLPEDISTQIEGVADWYSVGKSNADMKGESFPNFVDWWDSKKLHFLSSNAIDKETFDKIDSTLSKNYNLLTYTLDKIKDVLL